jgi:hypothetical protein
MKAQTHGAHTDKCFAEHAAWKAAQAKAAAKEARA